LARFGTADEIAALRAQVAALREWLDEGVPHEATADELKTKALF
jgi:hypothetical protein